MNETLDSPYYCGCGAKIVNRTGITFPSGGPHLMWAHEISNPSGWLGMLEATFDSSNNQLSLMADWGSRPYQIITFVFSNLVFDNGMQVVGVTTLASGNAVIEDSSNYTLSTSFTANSVTITYLAEYFDYGGQFATIRTASDVFQLQLGSAVPEPATISMMLAGLCGAFAFRRRKLAKTPKA